MTRNQLVWTVPCLLAVHNAEEAITFPIYLPRVRENAPLLMRRFAESVNYDRLFVALTVVTVVPLLVSLWSWLRPDSKPALWSVLLIQATVFLNVFAHLASAITTFRGYGPGLLTALLINLPFSFHVLREARRKTLLSKRQAYWLIPSAIFLHGPGLIAAFSLAQIFS